MDVLGVIFIVLAVISYLLAPASNEYVALIIIAGIFFLAAKMDSLYNKFINTYHRPPNNGNLARKPAPPSAANNVRYNDIDLNAKRMVNKEISNISSKDVDAFIDGIK